MSPGHGAVQLFDLGGRPLGQRALKKRRQLMDATVGLLRQHSLRDVRVVDIARVVGTSPATFYQYFRDVEDVVLQLAEEATARMPSLMKWFDGEWSGEQSLQKAREVMDAFITYWDEHGVVLRVRNVAADEGDERFMAIRSQATAPMLSAMTQVMAHAMQRRGNTSQAVKPLAIAVAMGAVLDRLSAYHRELEGLGLDRQDVVEAAARVLHQSLTADWR